MWMCVAAAMSVDCLAFVHLLLRNALVCSYTTTKDSKKEAEMKGKDLVRQSKIKKRKEMKGKDLLRQRKTKKKEGNERKGLVRQRKTKRKERNEDK